MDLDFQQSVGYQNQITIDSANGVLDELKALHSEWNFIEKVWRTLPRLPPPPS